LKAVIIRLDELSNEKVEFFSVRLGDSDKTEFEIFDETDFPKHKEELSVLYIAIQEIKERGAKQRYFHNEGSFDYMPVVSAGLKRENTEDYGIRLYCIWISETQVILLNGGIKTKLNPEECPNVKTHFQRAKRISVKLQKQLKNGELDNPNIDQHEFDV